VTRPVLRASEIGLFTYCERAWGYALRGERSSNQEQMAEGTDRHYTNASTVSFLRTMHVLGMLMFFLGLVLLAIWYVYPGG
jgi:hypothetical protein